MGNGMLPERWIRMDYGVKRTSQEHRHSEDETRVEQKNYLVIIYVKR
jgi:hypothetical protein